MPRQMQIDNEPRKPWTFRTGISFLAEVANVGGYALGVFKSTSVAATVANGVGFVFSRGADYFKSKEQLGEIRETKASARRKESFLGHRVTVNVAAPSTECRDTFGLQDDYWQTSAGRVSSTIDILSWLSQGAATGLNLCILSSKEYENNPGYYIGAVICGAVAIILPRLKKHYAEENIERAKTKADKQLGAVSDHIAHQPRRNSR